LSAMPRARATPPSTTTTTTSWMATPGSDRHTTPDTDVEVDHADPERRRRMPALWGVVHHRYRSCQAPAVGGGAMHCSSAARRTGGAVQVPATATGRAGLDDRVDHASSTALTCADMTPPSPYEPGRSNLRRHHLLRGHTAWRVADADRTPLIPRPDRRDASRTARPAVGPPRAEPRPGYCARGAATPAAPPSTPRSGRWSAAR